MVQFLSLRLAQCFPEFGTNWRIFGKKQEINWKPGWNIGGTISNHLKFGFKLYNIACLSIISLFSPFFFLFFNTFLLVLHYFMLWSQDKKERVRKSRVFATKNLQKNCGFWPTTFELFKTSIYGPNKTRFCPICVTVSVLQGNIAFVLCTKHQIPAENRSFRGFFCSV